jgi:hypothetical protein
MPFPFKKTKRKEIQANLHDNWLSNKFYIWLYVNFLRSTDRKRY